MNGPNESDLAASIAEELEADEWRLEVPYNYYGDRGVVDLVSEVRNDGERNTLHVFELKSEAALDEVTGANEILRQYNRHREYFIDGTDYNPSDYYEVRFELTFTATERCLDHVLENWGIYKTVHANSRMDTSRLKQPSRVHLRPLGESAPVHIDDAQVVDSITSRKHGFVGGDTHE